MKKVFSSPSHFDRLGLLTPLRPRQRNVYGELAQVGLLCCTAPVLPKARPTSCQCSQAWDYRKLG